MEHLILKVQLKSVYGNDLIYPACDVSKSFLQALSLKTFTPAALSAVKALGFKLVVIATEIGEI